MKLVDVSFVAINLVLPDADTDCNSLECTATLLTRCAFNVTHTCTTETECAALEHKIQYGKIRIRVANLKQNATEWGKKKNENSVIRQKIAKYHIYLIDSCV